MRRHVTWHFQARSAGVSLATTGRWWFRLSMAVSRLAAVPSALSIRVAATRLELPFNLFHRLRRWLLRFRRSAPAGDWGHAFTSPARPSLGRAPICRVWCGACCRACARRTGFRLWARLSLRSRRRAISMAVREPKGRRKPIDRGRPLVPARGAGDAWCAACAFCVARFAGSRPGARVSEGLLPLATFRRPLCGL